MGSAGRNVSLTHHVGQATADTSGVVACRPGLAACVKLFVAAASLIFYSNHICSAIHSLEVLDSRSVRHVLPEPLTSRRAEVVGMSRAAWDDRRRGPTFLAMIEKYDIERLHDNAVDMRPLLQTGVIP